MTTPDYITQFLEAMRAKGFEPKGKIIADDKWHQATAPGDTKHKFSGAYTLKIVSDDFAIGCFFSRKDPDVKHKWHSKSDQKLDPAEVKRIKKMYADQQKQKEIEDDQRQRKIARRLTAYYKRRDKIANHPYLTKKAVGSHNIKHRHKGNEIIIPLYGVDGQVWSIQRITTSGGKYLFAGARKRGSYFPMCKSSEDLSIILIAEGFATGATIREATSLPVIVAIDSGNLKPVAEALRKKYPSTKFVICADNDAFTMKPDGVTPWNVGREKAEQAAVAIGGAHVVFPNFSECEGTEEYTKNKPTDFNDLHALFGTDVVKTQIMQIVDKVPALPDISAGDDGDHALNQHPGAGAYSEADFEDRTDTAHNVEAQSADPLTGDYQMNYKVLGYDNGVYYYFPFNARQIVSLTASAHTLANLFRLDDLEAWETKFGDDGKTNEKQMVKYATNALMKLAVRRGVFKEEDRVRGCGAWLDEGRKILHCGDMLYVDGVEMRFDHLRSNLTYIAAAKLMRPVNNPLSNSEAYALRKICEAVTWENKLSGTLLAGWLVIAPICGALPFRPHIYLTGEAESGKSTVLNQIIKRALGKMSLNLDGGTTEPSVRQKMGHDARPLVYDEAEKSSTMPAVIELARKASTGSVVSKFGQPSFAARFCACFSAINPPVNKTADESRMSFMHIKKNRRSTAMQEYDDLLALIEATFTDDYSNRLLSRTLENMDVLFANIKIFQRAARKVIKGARASELVGTMLAGVYLLSKTDVIKPEVAEEWVQKHDWTSHTIIEEDTDPVRLLQYLSGSLLRYQTSGNAKEISIGDLIVEAARDQNGPADKLLRYNGIGVKDGRVYIASRSQNLEKILRDTDWSMKWTRMLSNIEGAEAFKIFYFGVGVKTSGVSLPIKTFTDKDPSVTDAVVQETQNEFDIPF